MSRLYLSNPCAFFTTHCTRCCGRSRRPVFPAPSSQGEGHRDCKPRAHHAAGTMLHVRVRPIWNCRNVSSISGRNCSEGIRPMTSRVDFTSQDYFRNPAAALERLRGLGPVVEVDFPIIGRVWATTTQALADRVLKDTGTFTIRKEDGEVAGLRWWMPSLVRTFANSMLSMDEPDHKRLRDVVDEAFRRRAVLGMEPDIEATAKQLADDLF